MTPQLNVSPAADRDLDEQAAYLASEASFDTAIRFYDAAAASFESLVRMPGIGESRETNNPRFAGLRVWRIQWLREAPDFLPFRRGRDRDRSSFARSTRHRQRAGCWRGRKHAMTRPSARKSPHPVDAK